MRNFIAGRLDHHALALLHRPTDPELLVREARALADLGLRVQDIGQTLGLAVVAVEQMLAEVGT